MKKTPSSLFKNYVAFTLAEVLAALIIGAMVLVAVLSIYSQAENAAGSIYAKLDRFRLPYEVLQRVAEDIDRITVAGVDAKITIRNKSESGYKLYRMEILRTIEDGNNQTKPFEEIIWQSNYDYPANSLILYRSHSGIALEDKLLDASKQETGRESYFVPICEGTTFFTIQVPRGEEVLDEWTTDLLPKGIIVTISFATPFTKSDNTIDVPDEEKIIRTIAINRTRKIEFEIVDRSEQDANSTGTKSENKPEDVNNSKKDNQRE